MATLVLDPDDPDDQATWAAIQDGTYPVTFDAVSYGRHFLTDRLFGADRHGEDRLTAPISLDDDATSLRESLRPHHERPPDLDAIGKAINQVALATMQFRNLKEDLLSSPTAPSHAWNSTSGTASILAFVLLGEAISLSSSGHVLVSMFVYILALGAEGFAVRNLIEVRRFQRLVTRVFDSLRAVEVAYQVLRLRAPLLPVDSELRSAIRVTAYYFGDIARSDESIGVMAILEKMDGMQRATVDG